MLGEVDLAHPTGAEQPLDHVAGEDLTAVQRHARKPTNRHASRQKSRLIDTTRPEHRKVDLRGSNTFLPAGTLIGHVHPPTPSIDTAQPPSAVSRQGVAEVSSTAATASKESVSGIRGRAGTAGWSNRARTESACTPRGRVVLRQRRRRAADGAPPGRPRRPTDRDFVTAESMTPMLADLAKLEKPGDSHPAFPGGDDPVSTAPGWRSRSSPSAELGGRDALQVVTRDVSARLAAEEALRYQAALVNHVSDGIIGTTADGTVTSWNPAAESIYGEPPPRPSGCPSRRQWARHWNPQCRRVRWRCPRRAPLRPGPRTRRAGLRRGDGGRVRPGVQRPDRAAPRGTALSRPWSPR